MWKCVLLLQSEGTNECKGNHLPKDITRFGSDVEGILTAPREIPQAIVENSLNLPFLRNLEFEWKGIGGNEWMDR